MTDFSLYEITQPDVLNRDFSVLGKESPAEIGYMIIIVKSIILMYNTE